MKRYFKLSDGMTTGEVANRVAGEEENRFCVASRGAQLGERMPLVGRKPALQEVDIIGHTLSCFILLTVTQVSDVVALMEQSTNPANKNINTSRGGRVGKMHQSRNFLA